LNFGLLQPYLGVLGQAAIVSDTGGATSVNDPLWGLGGDFGLDIMVAILRFGIELRGLETLTSINSDLNPATAFELQGLVSVRLSF